jgi:hypothetical protein
VDEIMRSKSWLITMVDEHGNEGCGSFKNIEIDGRLKRYTALQLAATYTFREKMSGFKMRKGGRWSDLNSVEPYYLEEVNDDYFIDYEEQLDSILPNGSGIDCKWEYEQKNDTIVCRNSFHYMDETGGYIGYLDFLIRFHRLNPTDFTLEFHNDRVALNLGLREYLYETLADALQEFKT